MVVIQMITREGKMEFGRRLGVCVELTGLTGHTGGLSVKFPY